MKRSRMFTLVVAVAAALSLAACSTDSSGTPEAGTSPGSTSSQMTVPSTSQPVADTPSQSGAGGAGSSAGGESSSAGQSSAEGQGSDDSQNSQSSDDGESSDKPTVTLGSGGLDAQSANWFNVFCTGMAPLATMDSAMSSVTATDPKSMQQNFVRLYDNLGDAFINTASKLQNTPPPTFDQGPALAGKLIQAMGMAGPAVKSIASQVAAAPATDMQSVMTAIETASGSMGQALGAMDIDNFELDPKTEADVESIPACKALGFDAGG